MNPGEQPAMTPFMCRWQANLIHFEAKILPLTTARA